MTFISKVPFCSAAAGRTLQIARILQKPFEWPFETSKIAKLDFWVQTVPATGLGGFSVLFTKIVVTHLNWELKTGWESAETEDSSVVNKYPKVLRDDKVNQDSWFWLENKNLLSVFRWHQLIRLTLVCIIKLFLKISVFKKWQKGKKRMNQDNLKIYRDFSGTQRVRGVQSYHEIKN